LGLFSLLDPLLDRLELGLDTFMVGVVLRQDFVHFLGVGMLLGGFDCLGVLPLDALDTVVVVL